VIAEIAEPLDRENDPTLKDALAAWRGLSSRSTRGGPGELFPVLGIEEANMLLEDLTESLKNEVRQESRLEVLLEALQEVIQKALREARLVILSIQFVERFGQEMTGEVEERLRKGSPKQILLWARRVLNAKTIEEVFGDEQAPGLST
jgi:sugar-specific transcriptional regulator TrmB